MNRREMIRGIGRALCLGVSVPFLPQLLTSENESIAASPGFSWGRAGRVEMVEVEIERTIDLYRNGELMKPGKDYIQADSHNIKVGRSYKKGDEYSISVRDSVRNPEVSLEFDAL